MRELSIKTLGICGLLWATGCTFSEAKGAVGPGLTTESLNSFTAIQTGILQPKCVACHQGSSASGGVDLTTYASIAGTAGIIVPSQPEQSLLYTEVQSGSMPQNGAPLGAVEVEAISTWILAGAPNGTFSVAPAAPAPVVTPPPSAPAPPTPAPVPVALTFNDVKKTVFTPYCMRCHSGANPSGRVDLSTYQRLLHNPNPSVITPGHADRSLIFTEIASGNMPPRGSRVKASELQVLRDWINQGAKP